jgi:hypothetical protein
MNRLCSLFLGALALTAFPVLTGCGGSGSNPGDGGDAGGGGPDGGAVVLNYPLVETAQTSCFNTTTSTACPDPGAPFYGQDAQFEGKQPSYKLSADGLTVLDNVTGLTWQKSPDTNGDGTINAADKMTLTRAKDRPAALNSAKYGGYSDWRLPTIKELYSLINFMGTDVGPGSDSSTLTPFIDHSFFDFGYGDTAAGERVIDAQYASSTLYVSTTMLGDTTLFGVNFADGRIKGYGLTMMGGAEKTFYVQCVRGAAYGANDFVDNVDSTIMDRASGLMWTKGDSAQGLNWQEALAWVQAKNAENYLGHNDWRLPNAKELQSIVDYTRSPDTTQSAAIDPLFTCTGITNEAGKADYPFYWTGTTHLSSTGVQAAAVYVAFGRAMGYMTAGTTGAWLDVHGAGAQRSDPKEGNPADYPTGRGPQGDAIRIYNYVRLVRNGAIPGTPDGGTQSDASIPLQDGGLPPFDAGQPPGDGGGPPPGDGGLGPVSCAVQSDCEVAGACPSALGCTCTNTPNGKACIPKCSKNEDCPKPPDQTLVCSKEGLCVPG